MREGQETWVPGPANAADRPFGASRSLPTLPSLFCSYVTYFVGFWGFFFLNKQSLHETPDMLVKF